MSNRILDQLAVETKVGHRTTTLANLLTMAHIPWIVRREVDQQDAAAAAREALTFTTREEYLAWVTDWKAAYGQTADQIRALKRQRSPKHRPESMSPMQVLTALYRARVTANALLAIRKASKARAGEQWAARRAAQQENAA